MPRNTMTDLTNHIFEEIERLSDESLTGDELEAEIRRGHAIGKLSKTVIDAGNLMMRAAEFNDVKLNADGNLPPLLGEGASRGR